MIINDEKWLNLEFFYENVGSQEKPQRTPNHIHSLFFETYRQIEDSATHA
jgi:hypothetical protein